MTKISAQKGNAPEVAATEASSVNNQEINQGFNMSNSTAVTTNSQPVFNFGDNQVRVVLLDGSPWFVASDVWVALKLTNPSKAMKVLEPHERSNFKLGRQGEVNVVSESGLYTLILRCRDAIKPGTVAHKFKTWVTSEVLPNVRKTGSYERTAFAVNPGDKLTAEEAETLRLMLKAAVERLPKEKQGAAMMQGWAKLKAHFKVSYREIPRHEFSEAVSIIARHTAEWVGGEGADVGMSISIPLEDMGDKGKVAKYLVAMRKKAERHLEVIDKHMADWELVDEAPAPKPSTNDAVRMDWAFTLANQAAAKVQRAVFNCVMNGGEDWKMKRYLLRFDPNSIEDEMMAKASQIESNACIVPIDRFHAVIDGSICVDAQTLSQLASTCMTRLSRMAQSSTRALAN